MRAPHDLAAIASPVRLAGKERPLALLIAETWEASDSRLHKFILLPQGGSFLFGPLPNQLLRPAIFEGPSQVARLLRMDIANCCCLSSCLQCVSLWECR